MKCEFSEMQFAVGIMIELANRCFKSGRGWRAPVLPTQQKEKELGYDVKITGPVRTIFFQFKVPEKKTTARANYWHEMGGSYYEFHLWPDDTSPQHNKLVDLSTSDPRNKVFYCSPRFHTNIEFDNNYARRTIAQNSIYVPCGTLKKIKGCDSHSICYTRDPRQAPVMHSEPYYAKGFSLNELEEDILKSDKYHNIRECLFSIADKFAIDVREQENTNKMYEEISNHLLAKENIVFILMGE
jgi:hypothetical protein